MIRAAGALALAGMVLATGACNQDSGASSEELRAIRELLEAQRNQTPPSGIDPARMNMPQPPPGADGRPPGPSGARGEPMNTVPIPHLLAMDPQRAESSLTGENLLVLRGTVWAANSERLPFLRGRNLPASAFFAFRDRDVQVFSPTGNLSFALDLAPGDLSCGRLRPCFTVTDEMGRLHTVWYQIIRDEQNTLRLHVLDCIRREEAENGVFPSDELLAENGQLAAVHRTEERLCVRPLGDPGYPAVTMEGAVSGPSSPR